jgi:hypothetical protein
VYNARDYGVKGDGVTDDLAAIYTLFERANAEVGRANPVYFFPAGRYMLSDKLLYDQDPKMGDKKGVNYSNLFVGMGPTLSQFVLKPNAPGFDDPSRPKQMFGRTGWSRETLGYLIDGLGFIADEDGTNPGSIAIYWQQHCGTSRNIVAAGGHTGMQVKRPKGQDVTMENIVCLGGRYGLHIDGDSYIFKGLSCVGFTEAGVRITREHTRNRVRGTSTSLLNFFSRGTGPAIRTSTLATVSVIGGRCEADPRGQETAVVDPIGGSTLINFETLGYGHMVNDLPAASGEVSALSFYSQSMNALTPVESTRVVPKTGKEA